MPRIKSFKAIRPISRLTEQVVTRPLDNFSLGQARLIASENPYSFLHLVNPELDNPYLRGSRQELVYKKVGENFESFLEQEVLIEEGKACIYIYQVEFDGLLQTGIWALTSIRDYENGRIKKHELTVERREKLLSEYLQYTGIDANPVLITYESVPEVEELINRYRNTEAHVSFTHNDGSKHRIWSVCERGELEVLEKAFREIPEVYIADGHHRIAAIATMARNRQQFSDAGNAESDLYFSTAYFSTGEVKILSFNRMVKDLGGKSVEEFLLQVAICFDIKETDIDFEPQELHEFGMYLAGKMYRLIAKAQCYEPENPISVLDVSILQDFILSPILGVDDPRTSARITFEGGKTPVSEMIQAVDHDLYAVAFFLTPTTVNQLIAVADIDGVMPPKSTWIEPKFLVGMLTNVLRKGM